MVTMPKHVAEFKIGDYITEVNGKSGCVQRIDGVTILPAPDEGGPEEPKYYYLIRENSIGESYGMTHGVYDAKLIETMYKLATEAEVTLYEGVRY